jgi:DNA-binding NarL/FixJ family response regulator
MTSKDTDRIQVMIVAPSQAMRAGLRSLLSGDAELTITREAASLAGVGTHTWREVDVLIKADAVNGLAASLSELQASLPGSEPFPALLLLSDEAASIGDLTGLPLRAWGILPVDASTEELIAAVHALHEGLIVAAPHLFSHLLASRPQAGEVLAFNTADQAQIEALTARETEVLQLLAQGLANKQIAVMLSISEHTVKFHVSSIYAKLGAANRTEAVRLGARRGLILL